MTFEEGGAGEVTPGNPAGFIAYHLSIGSSARESLAAWRELGGTSGNERWYRLTGEIENNLARTADVAALQPDVLPSAADYAQWSMGRGGQYATDVNVRVIDQDTGLVSFRRYTHVTDEPHTPEDAEAAAQADFGSEDNASKYGETIEGAFTVHVYQTVPWNG